MRTKRIVGQFISFLELFCYFEYTLVYLNIAFNLASSFFVTHSLFTMLVPLPPSHFL